MSKRLMPTYLIKFLENLYNGNKPLDFTRVMVTRQFIAKLKELYVELGGKQPENYTQVLVPKYLQDFFNELEIIEFDDDDISQEKTISSNLVYPACRIDSIGGMSYKSENLIYAADKPEGTTQGVTYSITDGVVTLNGTSTGVFTIDLTLLQTIPANTPVTLLLGGPSNAPIRIYFFNDDTYVEYYSLNTSDRIVKFTKTTQINRCYINIQSGGVFNNQIFKPMLVIGTYDSLDFVPGFLGIRDSAVTAVKSYNTDNELLDTYTVPSAITSLEGYGQGINNTVYNNVDFASGKYIKKVGVVDLGSLTYNRFEVAGLGHLFRASVPTMAYNNTTNLLCAKYDTVLSIARVNETIYKTQAGSAQIDIIDNSYNDAETFKTAMDGILLYFDLATPVETTITEQAPLLEVEEGGKVVFENEYNQDMPSEVVTWIKES